MNCVLVRFILSVIFILFEVIFFVKIYKKYKENAISIINQNPYRLAEDIRGIGFRIADDIAKKLADLGIFVWDGEFYAIATIWEVLKLQPYGGMVRIGMAPYILESDVDRTIAAIRAICEA